VPVRLAQTRFSRHSPGNFQSSVPHLPPQGYRAWVDRDSLKIVDGPIADPRIFNNLLGSFVHICVLCRRGVFRRLWPSAELIC